MGYEWVVIGFKIGIGLGIGLGICFEAWFGFIIQFWVYVDHLGIIQHIHKNTEQLTIRNL